MSAGPAPRARARPIGTRIFSLVGLGMVAPAVVMAWSFAAGHDELVRRGRVEKQLMASAAAERVSGALAEGLEAVNALATQEPWDESPASLERLRDALRRARVHHHALFDTFFAFDARGGAVAADTGPGAVGGLVAVAEARRLGRPGFVALAPTAPAAGAQLEPALLVLVPVVDAQGALVFAVGARVEPASPHLRRLLAPAPQSVHLSLNDGAGRRLAANAGPDVAPTDDEAVLTALRLSRGGASGACRRCAGGAGAEWAAAPVGAAHWAVLAWQPLDAANAFERGLVWRVGVAAVGLLGLALLFAWGATVSVTGPLGQLVAAAERIRQGDLAAPVAHLPGDEVGALGAALEAMRGAVQEAHGRVARLNVELEQRVAERTGQLQGLNDALAAREQERTRLLRLVISAQEDERKRVARELHDETSQGLAALSMGLEAASRAEGPVAQAALGPLSKLAADTLADVHRLIHDLRPSVLDDLGLQSALEWCADRTLRSKGVAVRCEFTGLEQRLPWELETAIFRAAQEALSNVARHSGAETVLLQAQVHDGVLTLEVEDDGCGFHLASVPPPRASTRGLGLMGMRERAEVFGGTLVVDSEPGQGTRVKLDFPLPQERRDA